MPVSGDGNPLIVAARAGRVAVVELLLSRGASIGYARTCVVKSITDWPASANEVPMLRTDIAALPGCEITKNTRSTIASVPRIFLPFIQTTVRAFDTTRRGSLYRTAAAKPSVSLTRGVNRS